MPSRKGAKGTKAQSSTTARPRSTAEFQLPGWAAPLVYALATIILFREFILGPDTILGVDSLALSYFARNFYTQFIQSFHTFPLWQPMLFGGMPFIDGMHGDIFYPPSLALFFMDAAQFWGWKMALHVFLAGCFTYVWLRELGLRRELALFGGLVYMMGADLVSLVLPGGDGKLFVSTLAPLAFFLTERAVTRRRISDYAIFSLGIALLVFTSHMQLVYFCIWGLTGYFFFRLFQQWRADRNNRVLVTNALAFAVAGVLGVAAAAVQFLPPLEYLRTYSHRSEKTNQASDSAAYAYSTTFSLHAEEVMALAVPEFVGDNAQTETIPGGRYWGRNGFKYNNEFAGFIPLLLLPLLFLRRRSARTWFFTALAVLAVIYGLGANTPLFRLFYLIPGVQLFRAPSIIIFLYGLALATLGALGLERALAWATGTPDERATARRYLWIATGVVGLLALLASTGTLVSMWTSIRDVANPDALNVNMPFIKRGFGITFLIALLVTLTWEGVARGMYGAGLAIAFVCVLAFAESYRVDRPFIRTTALINNPSDPLFNADEAVLFLRGRQQAGEVFRALDARPLFTQQQSQPNTLAVHGIEQIGGHHGNEIGRYRSLIGGDALANLGQGNWRLLDITNTQYMISPGVLSLPGFEEVFRGNASIVYKRTPALPRAFVVGRTEVVTDSQAIDRMLLGRDFDYAGTALVSEPLPTQIAPPTQSSVQWARRGVNSYTLKVTTDQPSLLVVLDNYYPMWRATVNGQETEIVRANYTFRGVPIPAGQHEVTFRYVASNVRGPALLSGFLLIALSLVGFGLPLMRRIRPRLDAAA